MGEEDRLQRRERRRRLRRGTVDARQQALGDPLHDRLPDRVLAREVAEQRALRQLHVAGDRRGGDLAGITLGRQLDHRLDGDRPTRLGG